MFWDIRIIKNLIDKSLYRNGAGTGRTTSEDSVKLQLSNSRLKNISVGRVARVSYLRHNDESSIEDDEKRTKNMLEGGHMSPFEHVATPSLAYSHYCGNLNGWVSYRKTIPNEHDMLGKRNN